MHITMTEEALQQVTAEAGTSSPVLKLVYDAEGCGCAVSGVAQLWMISEPKPDDVQADSNGCKVVYEKRHEVFFDAHMKLDYQKAKRSFILSSPQQIYHNQLRLITK
ncbi:iron-sulfur cluster biosynthesis family protein [Marinicrinis sediminis]|uniref:Iron-sulfur cluster biosynthesis family protein n=1 Tax=Marinicrinis sediminis TaxID=1652465 RepID=A0ABW5RF11_9BACL